jgi:GTP-binding protein
LINRRYWFVDLPGYGYAKAAKDDRREWAALVESYLRETAARLRLVLLVDGRVGATPLDVQAFEYLTGLGAALTVAVTKIDKVSRGKRAGMLREIRESLGLNDIVPLIPVSAHSGEGMKDLWGAIAPHLEASASARARE